MTHTTVVEHFFPLKVVAVIEESYIHLVIKLIVYCN